MRRLLYQRRCLIIGIMLLVVLLSALLLSLPNNPHISSATIQFGEIDGAGLDTQAQLLISPTNVYKVIDQLNLLTYREFRPAGTTKSYASTPEHLAEATQLILPYLSIIQSENPPTLTISFSGRSEDGALAFLNRLIKLYMASNESAMVNAQLISPPALLEYSLYPVYYYYLLILSAPIGLVVGCVFAYWVNHRQK